MKRPGISAFNTYDSPERVDFAKKCLIAAAKELDAFLKSFNPDVLAEARETYLLYFGGI